GLAGFRDALLPFFLAVARAPGPGQVQPGGAARADQPGQARKQQPSGQVAGGSEDQQCAYVGAAVMACFNAHSSTLPRVAQNAQSFLVILDVESSGLDRA